MVNPAVDSSKVFAQIARELAMQPDLGQTMQRLVHVTTQLTGCDVAAVWELQHGTRVSLRACNDDVAGHVLGKILIEISEGPARQALRSRSTCVMTDIDTETRWPRYVAEIRKRNLAIRSALAFSLDLGSKDLGALVLYSHVPGYFTEELIDIGGVIADHATLALDAAHNAAAATHLRQALDSNRRIGMAMGILMTLNQITDEQAFAMLRAVSQNEHVKLRELSEQVILTGALPEWPSRRPAA